MSKNNCCQTIRSMGLTCKWSSEWQEFIVDYKLDDARRTKDSSYHADDCHDAMLTAEAMIKWHQVAE